MNIPLRFNTWLAIFLKADLHRRLFQVALLLVLMVFCLYGFHALSGAWFKHEFTRATLELARQDALKTAREIGRTMPQSFSRTPSARQERWYRDSLGDLKAALDDLVAQNQSIIAAMIIDVNGRLAIISLPGRARRVMDTPLIKQFNRSGRSMKGMTEISLLNYMTAAHPSLEQIRIDVVRDEHPVAWLRLLVDRNLSQEVLPIAAERMTQRLTLLLVMLALMIVLGLAVIRRQQRMAASLIAQRNDASQLAYIGTLAAGLAHEIRNPLNALAMQLELLEEDVGEGAPQLVAPRLQRIRKGLAGVETTVHDFLNYAAPGSQKPLMVDLADELSAICEEMKANAELPNLQIECEVAAGLRAWCDPHALRQILGNLLSNGLRAQKSRPDPCLRVQAGRNGAWIDIVTDDAGPGVPPDQHDQVFEVFFTTQSEGTGLGLPIGRRLAEMNGGKLELAPEPSPLGGARFLLRLSAQPRSNHF